MRLLSRVAALFGAGPGNRGPGTVKESEPRPHLAFVLLDQPELPRGEDVVAAFGDIAPPGEGPVEVEPSTGEVLGLLVGGGASLTLALMPAPVPGGEADEAFSRSYSALLRGGDRELAQHRAHLVAWFRDGSGRSRHDVLVRFTYLLAAVAEASKAVGIYWGDAGATHDARLFIEQARERDPGLMLPLWCGVEIVAEGPDRLSMLSVGMLRQFGIMDLRMTAPRQGLAEHVGMMYDLLGYAVQRGSAVADGDTVGRDEQEKLRVRHERSPADPKERVWRVDVP